MSESQTPVALLRRPAVEARTGLSKSEIYRRIKSGQFPAPIALAPRCAAWPSYMIDDWIEEQIANSGRAAA